MYTLEEGSFFGELNIMFGLYSSITYIPAPNLESIENKKTNFTLIFKIDGEKFMGQICKDENTFKYVHDISIKRHRYNQLLSKEIQRIKK